MQAAVRACAPLRAAPDACKLPDDACAAALVEIYRALRDARARLSPRRAAAADVVVSDVVAVATRLADARAALGRGACDRIAPPGAVATQMLLGDDARTVLVRPLVALRAGRKYALVAYGAGEQEIGALRASVVPRPEGEAIAIPEEAFAGPAASAFAGDVGGVSAARTEQVVHRLEREAAAMPGLGPFSGVRVTLPEPLRPEQIGRLRFAFVPADEAPAASIVAVYRVLDARRSLLDYRARLGALECAASTVEDRDVKQTLGAGLPHVARLLRGTYRSLDLGDAEGGAARALGLPAGDAALVERPYLLALPANVGPETPLVIAVDGHAGSAARILSRHADALTERGMAVLAVELPYHGERRVEGRAFLDVLDPAALGRNIRQAAVDVLAAVQAASRCGVGEKDGEALRFTDLRYLGYSLGGMVGAIARSVEPLLGTAALVAPGGDILGWLVLRIGPELGAPYVTCLGGAQEGRSCLETRQCAPPGACIPDPYFERLLVLLALPYEMAAAGGDPLSYVTHRTGSASKGRLLLVTAGEDAALYPALATRLADAYGLRPTAPHRRRGPRTQMVQWPQYAHDLFDYPGVRAQVYEFLASDGRRLMVAQPAPNGAAR